MVSSQWVLEPDKSGSDPNRTPHSPWDPGQVACSFLALKGVLIPPSHCSEQDQRGDGGEGQPWAGTHVALCELLSLHSCCPQLEEPGQAARTTLRDSPFSACQ